MKTLIVANWKMNPETLAKAKKLFNKVKQGTKRVKCVELVICPPFVYLPILGASAFAKGFGGLRLGSQDCFWEGKGAFTGEISPQMLKNLGCQYAIIGHSERRKNQKETDEMIEKKIRGAKRVGLKPILCVDRLSQISQNSKGLIIAYEPLFAIGTGRPCTLAKAERMRKEIQKRAGTNKILYGGSVNSENARDYIKKAGFAGILVGGVSLKAKEFLQLIKNIDFLA